VALVCGKTETVADLLQRLNAALGKAAAGDIRACDTELHITLAPLSSPHRTRAAQGLCELLDQTATTFPSSRLRLRFAVRPPPCIGLAFPGSLAHRSTVPASTSVP
jgi:hypothetical protein